MPELTLKRFVLGHYAMKILRGHVLHEGYALIP